MYRDEALSAINKIKMTTYETQMEINNKQKELSDYINNLKNCKEKILSELKEQYLNTDYLERIDGVIKKMTNALSHSKTILDNLSSDATNEINSIVDSYNSSIDPKHPETPLEYEKIELTSVSGIDY